MVSREEAMEGIIAEAMVGAETLVVEVAKEWNLVQEDVYREGSFDLPFWFLFL